MTAPIPMVSLSQTGKPTSATAFGRRGRVSGAVIALAAGALALPGTATAEVTITQSHYGPFMVETQTVQPIDADAGETAPDAGDAGADGDLVRLIWESSDGRMAFELEDNGERMRSIFRADGDTPDAGCVGGGVLLGYSPQPSTNSFWVNSKDDFENVISSCASANLENLPATMAEYSAAADDYTNAIDAMKNAAIATFGNLWPRCTAYEGIELANDHGDAPCVEFDEEPAAETPHETPAEEAEPAL